jgi:hypothetical protein
MLTSNLGALGRKWLLRSFNGKLRDELNEEIVYTMKEAQIVIENWRRHCNTVASTLVAEI